MIWEENQRWGSALKACRAKSTISQSMCLNVLSKILLGKQKVRSQIKFGNAVKLLQQLEFWGPSSLTGREPLSPGSVQAGSTPTLHIVLEGNLLALVIQMD